MDNTSDDEGAKPLYLLVKNLVDISNTDSSSTVENSQLLDILHHDLGVQLKSMSELSIDIYMCILKKFLKSWPRWDEFDKQMKDNVDTAMREEIIQSEYIKLKEYLTKIIKMTKVQAEPVVKKMERKFKKLNTKTKIINPHPVDKGELVMEVACTRDQLNTLFYRKPHPVSLTIFNITEEPAPSKISLFKEISFKEVLNWPCINTSIVFPNFEFVRKNSSRIERTLINKKLPQNFSSEPLPETLYINASAPNLELRKKSVSKNVLMSYIVQIINYLETQLNKYPNKDNIEQLIWLFNDIKSDLLLMVNQMIVGSEYQYYMSKCPYVRYLSTDAYTPATDNHAISKLRESINPNDFDLYLEEKIYPSMKFEMLKFSVLYTEDVNTGRKFEIDYSVLHSSSTNWLRFECSWCDAKFDGFLPVYHIVSHMNSYHANEPDWQCIKCFKNFTANSLSTSRWYHEC